MLDAKKKKKVAARSQDILILLCWCHCCLRTCKHLCWRWWGQPQNGWLVGQIRFGLLGRGCLHPGPLLLQIPVKALSPSNPLLKTLSDFSRSRISSLGWVLSREGISAWGSWAGLVFCVWASNIFHIHFSFTCVEPGNK